MSSIVFQNVTKLFDETMVGIQNVTFTIEKGEFVFILGKSGAGKSTLLKLITKELEPTRGEIFIENEKIQEISSKNLPYLRRKLGIVQQSVQFLENKTVYDNIAFAMLATEKPYHLIKESVPAALGIVGMRKHALCFPKELSGGERFRIALARAIVNNPQVLVLDEPTANLDPDTAWDMMYLLQEINCKGVTIIAATHAQELVNMMRKRIVALRGGKVIADVKKGKYNYVI